MMKTSLASPAITARRLPPEILAHIFELVAAEAHYTSGTLVRTDPPLARRVRLEWLRCTHVCQYWRSTGIQHAALWNHIPAVCKPLWLLYANRARRLPLIITELPYGVEQWNRDDLTRRLSRAHTFSYHGSYAAIWRMVTILASGSDPILQNLSLAIDGLAIQSMVLPSDVLRKAASTLECICFRNISFLWSVIPPNIRVLDLSGMLDDPVEDILDGLRSTPQLEILSIQGLPLQTEIPLNSPFILPRLRRIVLSGHVTAVAVICTSITPHHTAMLDWSVCATSEADGNSVNLLLDTLSLLCRHTERPVCIEAGITTCSMGLIELTLVPEPCALIGSDTLHFQEHRAIIHVTIDDPYATAHERTLALSRLHCMHWRKLEVTGGTSWDVTRVIECFGQAKALEVLSLKDLNAEDAGAFFYALNPDFLQFEGRSDILHFPHLHSLFVSGVHFGCSNEKCDDPDALGDILDATLSFRKLAGHKLSLLVVKSCSVAFGDVWDWRHDGKCAVVEWDNDEGEAHAHLSDFESDDDGASDREDS